MVEVRELTRQQFEEGARAAGVALPIEQTGAWMDYESTIPDRTFWGHVVVERDGAPVAWASFADYQTHGYHYLRSHHGPVYAEAPTADEEREVLSALVSFVRRRDRSQAFVRLGVAHDLDICRPTLSITPYDATVVVDLSGTEDDLFSRMKPRGRRDVRKALRETPATYADETAQASADFSEYYEVMAETAERDGFAPAPQADYENMLRILGPERCRLFAGRVDGRVVTWAMDTVSDGHAVRYYAASRSDLPGRNRVTDALTFFEMRTLGAEGVADYDMMGIGSERYPELSSLNTFKCKFTKEVTAVAPDRDLPVKHTFYRALCAAKQTRDAARERLAAGITPPRLSPFAPTHPWDGPAEPREDILPIIFEGDIGAYALGREFHEAFGVTSVCVSPATIGAITHSQIFRVHHVHELTRETIIEAVRQIAGAHPTKVPVLICNSDRTVTLLCAAQDGLPEGCVVCVPPADVVERLSDKVEFAAACQRHGLDVAAQEVVDIATCDPSAPTQIPFPLVMKPARSSEYSPYLNRGFKKVYYVQDQAEMTQILRDLKGSGFGGTFLVQELIGGDDSFMDSITIYVDAAGKARMFGSARVLLEDHAPTMLGNPVAMITQQVDELWRKAGEMLEAEGYRGFANFDIKRDPRTGRFVFLEVNPRIGRNSYYNAAGGVNPMAVVVADLVDHRPLGRQVVGEEILYTLVPVPLLRRYLVDPEVRAQVDRLVAEGRVHDPQRYAADAGRRRMADVTATELNQVRKFAKYYPKPTETSF